MPRLRLHQCKNALIGGKMSEADLNFRERVSDILSELGLKKKPSAFISELLEQLDGPGPDVVLETNQNHLVGVICDKCNTMIAEPAGSVPPQIIVIRKPEKS